MPPAKKDSPTADPQNARWRIDGAQKHLLEEVFNEKRFPDPELKKRLASQLDVDPRRIQVWFQNRRQREKPQDPMSPSYEAGGPKWKPMHEPGGLPPTHIPSAASLPLPGPSESPISASPRKRARGSREGAPSNKPAPSRRGNGLDNGAGPSAAASGSGLHPMLQGAYAGAGISADLLNNSDDVVNALMDWDQVRTRDHHTRTPPCIFATFSPRFLSAPPLFAKLPSLPACAERLPHPRVTTRDDRGPFLL